MENPVNYNDLFSPTLQGDIDGLITKVKEVETSLTNMIATLTPKAQQLSDALSGSNSATSAGRNSTKNTVVEVEKLYTAYEQLGLGVDYIKKNIESLIATQTAHNKAVKDAEIVNKSNVDSITRLKAQIDLAKIALEGMSADERKNSTEGQTLTGIIKTLDSQVKAYNTSLKDNTVGIQASTTATSAQNAGLSTLGTSYSSLSGLIEETGVDINSLITSQKQMSAVSKLGETANNSMAGSYNQLEAQYNLIIMALGSMSEEMRNDINVGGKWEKQAQDITKKIASAPTPVNNYSKALNGLSISTQQIMREVPVLANSLQMFFIAISNNVPIFVDNFKRAQKELGGFKKAFDEMMYTILFEQGALILALTLISSFGSKWLSNIKIFQNVNKVLAQTTDLLKKLFESYDAIANVAKHTGDIEEDIATKRVATLKAQNAPLSVIQKAERDLLEIRKGNIVAQEKEYKDVLMGTDAVKDYQKNLYAWGENVKKLSMLQERATLNAKGSGEMTKADKQAIEAQQKIVEYYKIRIDAAEELSAAERNIAADEAALLAQQAADRYNLYKKEQSLQRVNDDISIGLTEDKYARERKVAVTETNRAIEDIQDILDKAPEWLSPTQVEAYNNQIKLQRKKLAKALTDIDNEESAALIALQNTSENNRLNLLQDGEDKELLISEEGSRQKMEAIKRRIDTEKDLTDKEREELQKQYDLTAEQGVRESTDIIYKYVQRDLKTALDYKLAVINNSNTSEWKMQNQSIEAQKQYWADYLANIVAAGNLSEAEIADITTKVNTELLNLNTQAKKNKPQSWGDILGIDADLWHQIGEMFSTSMEYMQDWMDKRIEMAQVAVDAAQKETDSAKSALDAEIEAKTNGYANNVELARKEYAAKLKLQKDAVAEQKRLQKIQEAVDTAQQISSLVTATASLWAAYAGIPGAGPALAIAATALMWGSFLAAKIQAVQLANAKTTYGEGMTEYVNYGGSHASGNDVDFGRDKNGRQRTVERGEVIGVINKKNVSKYGVNKVMDIVASINNGTFDKKYSDAEKVASTIDIINAFSGSSGRANTISTANELTKIFNNSSSVLTDALPKGFGERAMEANYGMAFSGLSGDKTDLSLVEQGIRSLIEQGETKIVQTEDGRIEYKGNNKRIIHN